MPVVCFAGTLSGGAGSSTHLNAERFNFAAGIKAILNFASGRIRAPKDVRFKSVDLSIELETLSFYLAQGTRA